MSLTESVPRAAYERFREERAPYNDGSGIQRGYLRGYLDGDPFLSLTPDKRDEHRAACVDMCLGCERYRLRGFCPSCGTEKEADDNERCIFCGGPLHLDTNPSDQASWWREL
jgi:hypothetical protein